MTIYAYSHTYMAIRNISLLIWAVMGKKNFTDFNSTSEMFFFLQIGNGRSELVHHVYSHVTLLYFCMLNTTLSMPNICVLFTSSKSLKLNKILYGKLFAGIKLKVAAV